MWNYELVKQLDNRDLFNLFWKENNYPKLYCFHRHKITDHGETDTFTCRWRKRKGFKMCPMQCQVVFSWYISSCHYIWNHWWWTHSWKERRWNNNRKWKIFLEISTSGRRHCHHWSQALWLSRFVFVCLFVNHQ